LSTVHLLSNIATFSQTYGELYFLKVKIDAFKDISADQMLENLNKNILNICKTYEYTTNDIIKENVKHVLDIVVNCSDKFDIYDKLKQKNLHSIAFRVIETKIIRIFSISGTESVEYIDSIAQSSPSNKTIENRVTQPVEHLREDNVIKLPADEHSAQQEEQSVQLRNQQLFSLENVCKTTTGQEKYLQQAANKCLTEEKVIQSRYEEACFHDKIVLPTTTVTTEGTEKQVCSNKKEAMEVSQSLTDHLETEYSEEKEIIPNLQRNRPSRKSMKKKIFPDIISASSNDVQKDEHADLENVSRCLSPVLSTSNIDFMPHETRKASISSVSSGGSIPSCSSITSIPDPSVYLTPKQKAARERAAKAKAAAAAFRLDAEMYDHVEQPLVPVKFPPEHICSDRDKASELNTSFSVLSSEKNTKEKADINVNENSENTEIISNVLSTEIEICALASTIVDTLEGLSREAENYDPTSADRETTGDRVADFTEIRQEHKEQPDSSYEANLAAFQSSESSRPPCDVTPAGKLQFCVRMI